MHNQTELKNLVTETPTTMLKSSKSNLDFRYYKWKTKDGFISIKDMTYPHLINTLKLVRNIPKEYENNVCGASKSIWIDNIKSELEYRDKLANEILFKFTIRNRFNNIPVKSIIDAAERGYYIENKRMVTMTD